MPGCRACSAQPREAFGMMLAAGVHSLCCSGGYMRVLAADCAK